MGPRSDFSKPYQGAAEKSANATRCCCLACGSQWLGMSTVEAVDRKISWLFCFVSHGCTVSARSVFSMSDDVGRCIALQSVPFLHQVSSAKRSFAFISGSASLSNSKRAVMEMVGSPPTRCGPGLRSAADTAPASRSPIWGRSPSRMRSGGSSCGWIFC